MAKASSVRYAGSQVLSAVEKHKQIQAEIDAIDQYRGLMSNAPRKTEQFAPKAEGIMPEGYQRDAGIDFSQLAQSPQFAQAMTNPAVTKMIAQLLSMNQVKLQGASPFENQYDQYGGLRQGAMEKPVAETKQDLGQPTYLAKAQRELEALRQANPNDPRIPQHEKFIQRIIEGIPTYQAVDVEGEGITPWNPRKGEFVGQPTGKFKPVAGTTKTTYTWIQDNLDTMDKLKSMSGLFDENTGFLTGRYQAIKAKGFNSPEYQRLRSTLGQMRTIIYGFSGKQINEQEQEWLKNEIIPELTNPTENFEVKMNVLDEWLNDKESSLKRNFPSLGQLPPRPRKYAPKSVTRTKNLEDMTDEELEAYENSLLGRK